MLLACMLGKNERRNVLDELTDAVITGKTPLQRKWLAQAVIEKHRFSREREYQQWLARQCKLERPTTAV